MLAAFYAALALGVSAKGPMGLLPLAVVLTWILTEDGWRGLRRLGSKLGAVVFVAVSAIWLIPFLVAGSGSFARNVVVQNWLGWYLGGPRPLGLLNYVGEFARGLVPWTVLMVLPHALRPARVAKRPLPLRVSRLARPVRPHRTLAEPADALSLADIPGGGAPDRLVGRPTRGGAGAGDSDRGDAGGRRAASPAW